MFFYKYSLDGLSKIRYLNNKLAQTNNCENDMDGLLKEYWMGAHLHQ